MAKTTEKKWSVIGHRQMVSDPALRRKTKVVFPKEEVAHMKAALSGMTCYDFALENVLAAGNKDLLRPSILTNDDIDATIANVAALDEFLDSIPVENNDANE